MQAPNTSGRYSATVRGSGLIRCNGPESLIGATVFNRYQIDGFLGEGSNAHVFFAHVLDSPSDFVVVKRIKPHVLTTPRFRQFFDNEVASMRRFHHPYVVRLLDADLDDPVGPILIMEYIPGITLEQHLTRRKRFSPEHVGQLLGPLCHGLFAAHNAGIVHRDLKPANLMVVDMDRETESIRVMDFGFAGFTTKPHIQLADLTGQGPVYGCGTPAYVSPEMVRADPVDHRGDLYSVGIILFELLTGRLPFEVPTQDEMLLSQLHAQPPRFSRLGIVDIPPRVEAVVQMLLSKYPNERHQNARELAEDFGKAIGVELWEQTGPAKESLAECEAIDLVECTLAETPIRPEDRYLLSDCFEAMLPERLAAAKLRGFIEDTQGIVISSEPGLIRVQIDPPPAQQTTGSRTAMLSWFSAIRSTSVPKGKEPIELDLEMHKLDANRVTVQVSFRPLPKYMPEDPVSWQNRCEAVYSILRKYLMAG